MKSPRCESSSSPIGRFERDRLLRDLQHLAHLRHRNIHALGDLFRRRLAAQFLHQLPRGADQLVDGLDHVHRDADGARLVGNRASNGLPNPPRGVSRKLVAAAVFEFVDGLHQADVAFLNQVEELQAAVGVLLRDRNHQAQVGFDQLALGLLGVHVALDDLALGALELLEQNAGFEFELFHFAANGARLAPIFFLLLFAARGLGLLFQVLRLTVERAHAVDGFVEAVDQALALGVGESELAHCDATSPRCARQLAAGATMVLGLLLLRDFGELLGDQRGLFVGLDMSSILPVNSFRRFCRISSVISSSSKVTTSLMERTPFFRSSPIASSSWITMGERDSAFRTRIWPRSMRLAISTSPSRVSSGTVPISRKYMRTGSLVFSRAPGVRSSSTSSPFFVVFEFFSSRGGGQLGAFEDVDALRTDRGQQIVQVFGTVHSCGMRSLTWS